MISTKKDSFTAVFFAFISLVRFVSKFQFHPDVAMALTLSSEGSSKMFTDYFVGGYQNIRFNDTRFWGLNYAEIRSPNFIKLGAEIQYITFNKIYIRAGANILGYSEQIPISDPDLFKQIYQSDRYLGYGMDISYQSILGPISVGIGGNDRDKTLRSYFSMGFSFNYSDR